MPSQFESMMAASLPGTHYATFGLSAVYTAPDSTTTNLTVRVQRDDPRQIERSNRADGEQQTGTILCMASDLPKPVKGGRFTVENVEVWTVEVTPKLVNGEHVCSCIRTGVVGLMSRRAKE